MEGKLAKMEGDMKEERIKAETMEMKMAKMEEEIRYLMQRINDLEVT